MNDSPFNIPMEWESSIDFDDDEYSLSKHILNKEIKKIKDRIYNTVVPKDCFRINNYTTEINENERLKYFIKTNSNINIFNNKTKNNILNNFAIEWIKKPYCFICYNSFEENQYIVEHKHDLNKRGIYNKNLFAGIYRGKACKRCNAIEAHAKFKKISNDYYKNSIPNFNERLKYWCTKNNFLDKDFYNISTPKSEFICQNLSILGYMDS